MLKNRCADAANSLMLSASRAAAIAAFIKAPMAFDLRNNEAAVGEQKHVCPQDYAIDGLPTDDAELVTLALRKMDADYQARLLLSQVAKIMSYV